MKRCPQCHRVETDDALVYCRVDGTALITDSGSVSTDVSTAKFGSAEVSSEIDTSILPHTSTTPEINRVTAPTTVLPPQQIESTTRELTKPKRRGLVFALLALIVAGIAIAGYLYFSRKNTTTIQSIAVMPFVNASGNADLDYLSDGMTETLIKSLSQLPNLNVKARSSVFRYKGKDTSPQTTGKELNVQAILNGRVVQRGEQLTLSLELIDAQTENVIWSESYNRKQADLVSLQSEIARDVSSKLKAKLSGADEAKVAKNYTANTEAYQLYLKGRFYGNKRTSESLREAIEFYKQAIEKDPNYALAYSGLAETYVLLPSYSVALAKDSMPQAKAAALRALELDDSLAEAHTALASYLDEFEWDRSGSEKEYRRAIELNPNYATAYQWLGAENLVLRKRFDEAIAALRRGEELDPLSPIISMNLGLMLIYARHYDEGIAQLNHTLSLGPNFAPAHTTLGWAFQGKGMYREAITEYQRANDLSYDPINKGFLAISLAKAGRREEAAKLLSELKQESTRRYVPSYAIALAHIGLNEKDEAFVWLEKEVAGVVIGQMCMRLTLYSTIYAPSRASRKC